MRGVQCKHFPGVPDCVVCAEEYFGVECDLCGEVVAKDEQEQGTCLDCCEREHQRQERPY